MRAIALLAAVLMLGQSALAEETEEVKDPGKTVFAKCAVCHAVGPDAANKVGPVLNGIVGRKPGSTDFSYSQAMYAYGEANPVWTEELLDKYLADPKEEVPRGKMAFVGLKKAEDRAAVIDYLKRNP